MADLTILPEDQRPSIIVADAVDVGRKLLISLLGKRYNIIQAKNGLEVINILEKGETNVSCILLDLLMPVVDGIKVLDFMRKHDLVDQIPVIAVTAISDAAGKIACYDAGAVDIIEKPFNGELLLNRVNHYVEFFARMNEIRRQAPAEDSNSSYFSAILDSLPQAVFVFENATMRVKYSNAPFTQIPGVPPSPTNMTLAEIFKPADYAAILAGVSELLTHRVQRPVLLQFGGQRFAVVFNAILDASGNVADIVGTAVNMTQSSGPGI
ncbi:MAG: response regulator [Kiritimatiellae bacterium]|nr:response regulator [Kiritimatiellia bacterium]